MQCLFNPDFYKVNLMFNRIFAGSILWLACSIAPAVAHEYFTPGFTFVHPWAEATAPGQLDAPVYFVLDNVTRADTVLRAATPAADSVELRSGADAQATSVDQLSVPVGDSVAFTAGKAHLVLRGLKAPLQWGRSYLMMVEFEKAGKVLVMVSVGAH
jgi:periplasmic copper chaperone A